MIRAQGSGVRTRFVFAAAMALFALAVTGCAAQAGAPVEHYQVLARYPHSASSYTEGFLYLDGYFYEGVGLAGQSGIRVTEPKTGRVVQRLDLPEEYFGEGIVDWGRYLYEWTWQSHVCFVYDRFSMKQVKKLSYEGEGWGMTRNAHQLITSDGTATLRFRDPESFREKRRIEVHDGRKKIDQLNELEWIKGEIWANLWHSDRIARISPADGHVIAWVDLTGLLGEGERANGEAVLNGIAYDATADRIFITGKLWPAVFEIKVTK